MNSIFRGIDEDRTIENSKRVLGEYLRWKLKARRVDFSLQSPAMDGMPKSESFENHVEQKHVNKINAEFMATLVEKVIKAIEVDDQTAIYSQLLWFKYIKRWTNVKCAEELNWLPDRTFDRYHREALLMFAEVYPGAVEELIVKKYDPQEKADYGWS